MNMRTTILILAAVAPAAAPSVTEAQLRWRVSVKVIRDEHGLRAVDGVTFPGCCDLNTDAEIEQKFIDANAILEGNGPADVPATEPRGYTLELLEIVDLYGLPTPPSSVKACGNDRYKFCSSPADCPACSGGANHGNVCTSDSDCPIGTCTGQSTCYQVAQWFDAPSISDVRNAIRDAATVDAASKTLWGWRDDAINMYILGSDGSGTAYDMVLLGQDLSSPNTPFHEIGHFLHLDHTHGGGGSSPDCVTGGDDFVDDTLADNCGADCGDCWDRDQIAAWNFPTECGGPCTYAELLAADQHRVEQVFFNLMCYRRRREVLTYGQLDRMTDHSNGTVNHVASGRTRFVDYRNGSGIEIGSSTRPHRTVGRGLSFADPGDVVLIRNGSYGEVLEINQSVTLRATQGDAWLGPRP